MKKLLFLLFALVLISTLAIAEGPVTVIDMLGREITLSEPVTRIVALTASDCEILCALGCEEALVGRGEYCDYPESVLDKPSVQSGYNTNAEEIIALEPQVVLMSTMAQSVELADTLATAGIEVVISDAIDIEGVYTSIRLIGALMGRQETAETLISEMQSTFAMVKENCVDTGKTVYFEVSPLQYGLWAAGKGTFMDELATMCGLTNAFADVDGWGQISEEQVIARDPDYIVTITMYFGEGPTPIEEIKSRTGWENLKAIQNDDILNADSNEISRPGPRLQDAVLTLYHFVHEDVSLPDAA
ncbi:MAG: ABC transporter substrate-binding protein [Clostridia bacterium]|nr:ABC transporter substrate-binding protein [Clostridia bacterium]